MGGKKREPAGDVSVTATRRPPLETDELRKGIQRFFRETFHESETGAKRPVGGFRWGVYAFYDYDGEPIYVGQTKEKLSGRVGRHLTNQRTDAVAMSVLDPFEVADIEVWPLPEFEGVGSKHPDFKTAKAHLDALEHMIFTRLRKQSRFGVILNEKDPPAPTVEIIEPPSFRGTILNDQIRELRGHPDSRLARRALTVSKLAQVISERELKGLGLRRVLLAQASRMRWLAEQRFLALGGEAGVEVGPEDEDEATDTEE
ncbi:GIY-YIG nuclease family protein [Rhizobium leguminosarum]|uniref:GIY-YIG nuclease family protein n=1 Tax=Rhizobium leguminosarum TaxID=384 RepID=UPI001C95B0A8|nr:GIY-YIG nuclease family protein [Rhizobium leguminosarum]MBY5475731.1 GIY-YIG nuclease family protein [Rhizobium leguminosarum]